MVNLNLNSLMNPYVIELNQSHYHHRLLEQQQKKHELFIKNDDYKLTCCYFI